MVVAFDRPDDRLRGPEELLSPRSGARRAWRFGVKPPDAVDVEAGVARQEELGALARRTRPCTCRRRSRSSGRSPRFRRFGSPLAAIVAARVCPQARGRRSSGRRCRPPRGSRAARAAAPARAGTADFSSAFATHDGSASIAAGRVDAAAPVAEVRLPLLGEARHRRRVAALVVDREVLDVRAARALRLVEVVRAVPRVGLGAPVVLDDGADPVVALVVEALRRRGRDARRLERQELDDAAAASRSGGACRTRRRTGRRRDPGTRPRSPPAGGRSRMESCRRRARRAPAHAPTRGPARARRRRCRPERACGQGYPRPREPAPPARVLPGRAVRDWRGRIRDRRGR